LGSENAPENYTRKRANCWINPLNFFWMGCHNLNEFFMLSATVKANYAPNLNLDPLLSLQIEDMSRITHPISISAFISYSRCHKMWKESLLPPTSTMPGKPHHSKMGQQCKNFTLKSYKIDKRAYLWNGDTSWLCGNGSCWSLTGRGRRWANTKNNFKSAVEESRFKYSESR